MPEYIERSAALDKLDEALVRSIESGGSHEASGLVTAKCQIAAVPTADVVEVRHGEWERVDFDGAWKCSICGEEIIADAYGDVHPFDDCGWIWCPKCGAKMDGERRE